MSARIYLITEGVHDVAFLGKLLQATLGFAQIVSKEDLDSAWEPLLPTWPYKGSLRGSVPVPSFYRRSSGDTIAIVNAQGISEINKRLRVHRQVLDQAGVSLDAVGIVLDADSNELPAARFTKLGTALASQGLSCPATAETVAGTPRTGIFVLPGGGTPGTLEDLLLECAALVYPTLSGAAASFVDGLDRTASDLTPEDLVESGKPAGRNKAAIAAMGAVLKPGKPIQASLQDHRWIEPRTIVLSRISALSRFLGDLAGVPATIDAPRAEPREAL
ncbi:MAG: DUF3226 domain-containing protein [Byssovorax sp.]